MTPHRDHRADSGQLLVRALDDRWRKYQKELKRCQKKYSEASVHDLRVATRRLISTLNVLRRLVLDDRLTASRRTLKKRLDLFDPLRDTQVQLLSTEKMLPTFPELQAFYDRLKKQERRLVKQVSKQVGKMKTAKLAKSVAAIEKQLRLLFNDRAKQNEHLTAVKAAVDAAFAKVADLRRSIDPNDATTIHRLRIAFKKFRYMVEALRPLLARVTDRRLKKMHDFQTMMGDIQDIEVLTASLRAFAQKREADSSLQAAFQELSRRRVELIETFLKSADELFTF
jgi:CHAD domain-containing protein